MSVAASGTAAGTALITGAGSGIGRAVSRALLDAGWTVVLAGRREATLRETAPEGERVLLSATDVADEGAVDALFAGIRERFGRLDLLFNNAGIAREAEPDRLDLATWSEVVATNLTGAFLVARAAFRMMREQAPQGGRIINNGSVSAHVPRPHSIAYTTTKHGITGMTKSLSLDGRPYGISCGQIDIGNARTSMGSHVEAGSRQPDGTRRVEPTMDVDAVARAVLLMASLPAEANVQNLTVLASGMPFVGRG